MFQGSSIQDKKDQDQCDEGKDEVKTSAKERDSKGGIGIMDVRESKKTAQYIYGSP